MIKTNPIKLAYRMLESWFNLSFGPSWNPLYNLGTLTLFFFWVVLVSGLYLFIFFDTSIAGAYNSVEYITHEQWYMAGVMRSLHRYASDAAVITIVLHMFREVFTGPASRDSLVFLVHRRANAVVRNHTGHHRILAGVGRTGALRCHPFVGTC